MKKALIAKKLQCKPYCTYFWIKLKFFFSRKDIKKWKSLEKIDSKKEFHKNLIELKLSFDFSKAFDEL